MERTVDNTETYLVTQNVCQRELVGAGNLLFFAQLLPVGNDRLPISGVKSPQISHNAGCEQNVSGDVDQSACRTTQL